MSGKKGGFVIFGAIAGFLLGMFLAPKKGADLRRDAKEKLEDIKENPDGTLKNTLESVKDKLNSFSESLFDDEENEGFEDVDVSDENIVITRAFKEVEDNEDIILNKDKEDEEI